MSADERHPGKPCNQPRARVVLADDHQAARGQAERVLAGSYDIVGEATDGLELMEAAGRLDPDVIVLDISMPRLGGFDAARSLKQRGCRSKLVFLTVYEDADFAREAMAVGGEGYVVKSRLASDLETAVSEALAGRTFISPTVRTGTSML
ncbi:MAG TPA: response regulator transcription factor [Candidatus Acidoferrum sp.]|nr:response regulator transcription factor [Candidatus Acidoferrum sp.]